MAKKVLVTVKIGGKTQMQADKYELARDAVRKIATIANPAAETVAQGLKGLEKLGGAKNFATMLENGNPDSMIEVYENDEIKASYKVGNLAKKILVALDAANWTGQIFTVETDGNKSESVAQEMPELDLS